MFRTACLFLVPLVLLPGCSDIGKDAARAQSPPPEDKRVPVAKDVIPGFDHCSPAIFFQLQPEATVAISEIAYDKDGLLRSFREQIVYDNSSPVVVNVSVDVGKWSGLCSSLEYSVETGGKRMTSPKYDAFDGAIAAHTAAFSAEEPLGIILSRGPLQGDLSTELAYDAKGRQYIKRQAFEYDGMNYEVRYSDYSYLGPPTGKASSYTAHISAKPKPGQQPGTSRGAAQQ